MLLYAALEIQQNALPRFRDRKRHKFRPYLVTFLTNMKIYVHKIRLKLSSVPHPRRFWRVLVDSWIRFRRVTQFFKSFHNFFHHIPFVAVMTSEAVDLKMPGIGRMTMCLGNLGPCSLWLPYLPVKSLYWVCWKSVGFKTQIEVSTDVESTLRPRQRGTQRPILLW